MKNDLLIMLRVLLLLAFAVFTVFFAKFFIILGWVLFFVLIVVGYREARKEQNIRIQTAMDDLRLKQLQNKINEAKARVDAENNEN